MRVGYFNKADSEFLVDVGNKPLNEIVVERFNPKDLVVKKDN